MLDPEIADAFARVGEGETIRGFRVCEAGWVEIHAHLVRLCPIDPAFEMFWLYLVAVYFFSAKLPIERVEVEPMFSGDQGESFIKIRTEFFRYAGFSRMVSRHGDPAAQSFARVFKSPDIIALPAMERNRKGREFPHDRIRIHTHIGITLFCGGIAWGDGSGLGGVSFRHGEWVADWQGCRAVYFHAKGKNNRFVSRRRALSFSKRLSGLLRSTWCGGRRPVMRGGVVRFRIPAVPPDSRF